MGSSSNLGCSTPGWALLGFFILWMMGHFWYGLILMVIAGIIYSKQRRAK